MFKKNENYYFSRKDSFKEIGYHTTQPEIFSSNVQERSTISYQFKALTCPERADVK